MAYVSIAVNVGSFNDPPQRQGLAHFLEHMIFMGSEKYPDENAFSDFVTAHGGYSNAFTEFEYTNYQFKVDYQGLQKALDLQAHLFASPLLLQDAMEREIKAVESEF
jgi:nardilysin